MNCRKARSLLSAFSKDELSHSVREKLLEHLEACQSCRKESALAKQVSETIRHLPKQELSDDFNMRLFERIHNGSRAERLETVQMPKAAPSALTYRLKFVTPVIAAAGILILALTLTTGTTEVNPAGQEVTTALIPAQSSEQSHPSSQSYTNSGLRGLKLEQAMRESLLVAVSGLDGNVLERLAQQQRQGFGTLDSRSLVRNVSRRSGNMRYVLPNVPSRQRLAKNAAY